MLVTSKASPHWGVEWKTLYCCAWTNVVRHIYIFRKEHRRIYGFVRIWSSRRFIKLTMDMLDLEVVVNDEDQGEETWIHMQLV